MPTTVTVQSQPNRAHAQRVTSGQHTWVADEPIAAGGEGLGPSPFELLLGALGSCTAITLQIYARRKGWPLTDVSIRLTRERHHEENDGGPTVEDIHQEVALRGDLTPEQRQRLLEIAGRCPVHRALTAAARITETLAAGE